MLEEIIRIIAAPIVNPLEELVASVEELKAQIADVKTSLQAALERIEEDFENLKQGLADRVDAAELEPISQGLADLKDSLDALDPDPDNPAQSAGKPATPQP